MSKNSAKQREIEKYQKLLSTMLSDADITNYLGGGKEKIVKYSELADYETLEDLLPEERDYRIVLTESKRNQGHWCALVRNGNTFIWFDSYGAKPDGELKFIPMRIRRMLGEVKHHLTRLLSTTNPSQQVIYNKKRFQSLSDDVDTCGRWVVAFVFMNKIGYTLEDFIDKVEQVEDDTGKPSDIIVCDWVK